ncbi:MAG: hypothetical protein QGG64_21435 [Candidatus Latescibacteria bacterium]|nr:hypothetical protein [Candidatus Latescibacterota bacterium]
MRGAILFIMRLVEDVWCVNGLTQAILESDDEEARVLLGKGGYT